MIQIYRFCHTNTSFGEVSANRISRNDVIALEPHPPANMSGCIATSMTQIDNPYLQITQYPGTGTASVSVFPLSYDRYQSIHWR